MPSQSYQGLQLPPPPKAEQSPSLPRLAIEPSDLPLESTRWANGLTANVLQPQLQTLCIGVNVPENSPSGLNAPNNDPVSHHVQLFRMQGQQQFDSGYYIRLPQDENNSGPPRYYFTSGTRTVGMRTYFVPAHIYQNGRVEVLEGNTVAQPDLGFDNVPDHEIVSFLNMRWGSNPTDRLTAVATPEGSPQLYTCSRFQGSFTPRELLHLWLFDLRQQVGSSPTQNVNGIFTRPGFSGSFVLVNSAASGGLRVYYGGGVNSDGAEINPQFFGTNGWGASRSGDVALIFSQRINRNEQGQTASNAEVVVVSNTAGTSPTNSPTPVSNANNTASPSAAPSPSINESTTPPRVQDVHAYESAVGALMQNLLANNNERGIAVRLSPQGQVDVTSVFGTNEGNNMSFGILIEGNRGSALCNDGNSRQFGSLTLRELSNNPPLQNIQNWVTSSDAISQAQADRNNREIFRPFIYNYQSDAGAPVVPFVIFPAAPEEGGSPRLFVTRVGNIFNPTIYDACLRQQISSLSQEGGPPVNTVCPLISGSQATQWIPISSNNENRDLIADINNAIVEPRNSFDTYQYFARLRPNGDLEIYRGITAPGPQTSGQCFWSPHAAVSLLHGNHHSDRPVLQPRLTP